MMNIHIWRNVPRKEYERYDMLVHIALLRVFMLKNQEKLLPLTITIEPRHILAMNRHYDSINKSVKRNPTTRKRFEKL